MNDDGKVIIGTELDTKSFDKQIDDVKRKLDEIDTILSEPKEFGVDSDEFIKLSSEAERLKNRLIDLNLQKEKLNKEPTGFQTWLKQSGKEIEKNVKKIKNWTLAIFGIRSAYSLIRGAMSEITSQNEQISTDVQYMRWILAQTLKPVVEWIIKGLYTVIALINSISKSIFGVNLLAGKSADEFKNAQKSIGGMSKGLKEAKKQLAGFDEMNVLQDTTSQTSGGGGGDLGNWNMPDFNQYNQKVEEAKKSWSEFGEQMRVSLEEMPWNVWIESFGVWGLAVKGVTQAVYGLWQIVDGIIKFIKGVLDLIVGLVTGDTEKIKQGIVEMLDGLLEIIKGVIDLISGLVNTVAGLIIGIVGWLLQQCWNILKGVGSWIYDNIIKPIADFFTWLWNGIVNGVKSSFDGIKSIFGKIVDFFKGIIDKILGFFKNIGTSVGEAIGGSFKAVINGILGSIEKILNSPIKAVNKLLNVINDVPGINLKTLPTFKFPRLAKGGIVNNPGSGVMMGSYIAGERGPEAVIPLDDYTLDRLGLAFARHTQINATVPVYVGNRQIAREIKRINAEDDFAYNS